MGLMEDGLLYSIFLVSYNNRHSTITNNASQICFFYSFLLHSDSLFYGFSILSGVVGIVWFIFWLLLGYSSPATHPRISYAERKYIETSIAESKSLHQDDAHVS